MAHSSTKIAIIVISIFLIVIVGILILVISATSMVVIRVILIRGLALVYMCAGGCGTGILPSCKKELLFVKNVPFQEKLK